MAIEKKFRPLDIIETILLFTPSKSLRRFKSVCKSWNAIISNHTFVKKHHQQLKRSKNRNVFLWKGSDEYCIAKLENGKVQVEPIREKPCQGKDILCSGDGLALLSTSSSKSYVLWNPFSKQNTKISCDYRFDLQFTAFGICHDPSSDDYKIVAKCSNYYTVFSCKNKSWSEVKGFPFILSESITKGGLSVGGFSFWVMTESERYMPHIFYFDPKDEKFNKLQKPTKIENERNKSFSLTSFRDRLCLYDNVNLGNLEQLRVRIWILDDNNVDSSSWSQLMIIEGFVDGFIPWNVITPLFFADKNELVILSGCIEGDIGMYNSAEKKYEVFDDVPQSLICTHDSVVAPCLDTLFFPMSSKNKN